MAKGENLFQIWGHIATLCMGNITKHSHTMRDAHGDKRYDVQYVSCNLVFASEPYLNYALKLKLWQLDNHSCALGFGFTVKNVSDRCTAAETKKSQACDISYVVYIGIIPWLSLFVSAAVTMNACTVSWSKV